MPAKDKVVLISSYKKFTESWIKAFKEKAPEIDLEVYPDDTQREDTKFILCYDPPKGVFQKYPNLRLISSMTAGINHILKDSNLPQDVYVTKVNDPLHKYDMATYALTLCLGHIRNMPVYATQKRTKKWKQQVYQRPEDVEVGIMGFGSIGQEIGKLLIKNDFKVNGWSRSSKDVEGITSYFGQDQLDEFLQKSAILICVLPLTKETEGVLNRDLFNKLPEDAYLINMARGAHLVEEDLEKALKEKKLSGAALDVFGDEPLPENHSFWENEKITITPHVAGIVTPESVLTSLKENYRLINNGEKPNDTVDVSQGY